MRRHAWIVVVLVLVMALGAAVQVSREEFDRLSKRVTKLQLEVFRLTKDMKSLKSSLPEKGLNAGQKPQKAGKVLGAWQGSGIKATKVFRAESPWWIEWTASGDGTIDISVYEFGSNRWVELIANETTTHKPKKGESYIYDSGDFYLKIGGYGSRWSVRAIQEAAEPPVVP